VTSSDSGSDPTSIEAMDEAMRERMLRAGWGKSSSSTKLPAPPGPPVGASRGVNNPKARGGASYETPGNYVIKAEIAEIYRKVDPEKLKELRQIFRDYEGREEELYSRLKADHREALLAFDAKQEKEAAKKEAVLSATRVLGWLGSGFGAVAALPSTIQGKGPGSNGKNNSVERESLRREITILYEQANPDKVKDLPTIFHEWEGNEEELLAEVRQKYLGNLKMEIKALYQQANPSKLSDIDGILEEWEGKEHELLVELKAKYKDKLQEEIKALYRQANPSKLSEINGIFGEWEGKEHELLAELKAKYSDASSSAPPLTPPRPDQIAVEIQDE
jgi:hypothetical protein